MGIAPSLRSSFPGSEIVGSAKMRKHEHENKIGRNLPPYCVPFTFTSSQPETRVRIGGKRRKKLAWVKKKSVSRASRYLSYLTPFLPFFPQWRAWSQANVLPALSCLPYYLRAWNRLLLRGNKISERANRIQTMVARIHPIIKLLVLS